MTIMKSIKGDILSFKKGIIVHGCNSMGRFNKGLAKSIRETYPRVYMDYMYNFHTGRLKPGINVITKINDDLYIVSSIIQKYYGNDKNVRYVDYSAVEECFRKINEEFKDSDLPIYIPSIGAGLANGDWKIIQGIIEKSMGSNIHKIIHVLKDD